MRFFAVHDREGNIARIVGCPDDAPPTFPASMGPGQAVAEVALPDGVAVSPDRDILADLREVAENYRLDVSPGPSVRITRKDRSAGE
jgi:hypothetical protein